MIIDGKHYPSEENKTPPRTSISPAAAAHLFRLASLLYSASFAIARPISNTQIIYENQPDPLMPMPQYPSEERASLHQRIPFTGRLNTTSDIVIAGDHTLGYEPGYKWITHCFDFKHDEHAPF